MNDIEPSAATRAERSSTTSSGGTPSADGLEIDSPELAALMRAHPQLANYDAPEVLRILVEQVYEAGQRSRDLLGQLDEKERIIEELKENSRLYELKLHASNEQTDALLSDRDDLEETLAGKDIALEKLRSTLRDTERGKKEVERRYREQTVSIENERQSWQDQEALYESKVKSLGEDLRLLKDSVKSVAEEEVVEAETAEPGPVVDEATKAELETLNSAHASLMASYKTLQAELSDLKHLCTTLQDDNESYLVLLEKKTLKGDVEIDSITKDKADKEKDSAEAPMETPTESLESIELKNLKEANQRLAEKNKALTLYCSKIIDKILSQDGYEKILASDSGRNNRKSGVLLSAPTDTGKRSSTGSMGHRRTGSSSIAYVVSNSNPVYSLGHRHTPSIMKKSPGVANTARFSGQYQPPTFTPSQDSNGFRPLSLSAPSATASAPAVSSMESDQAKKESLFVKFSNAIARSTSKSFMPNPNGATAGGLLSSFMPPKSDDADDSQGQKVTFGAEEYDEEDEREREKLRKHLAEMGLDSQHVGNTAAWDKHRITGTAELHDSESYTQLPPKAPRRPSKKDLGLGIGLPSDSVLDYGPQGDETTWSERMRNVSMQK